MNVSEAGRKRTSELVDQTAHEAGLVDKDHHVRGNALAKSGTQVNKERNDVGSGKDVGVHVAVDGLLEAVALGAEHSAKLAFLEGPAEVVSIVWLAYEALHALSDAEKKGVEIKDAFDNDAVNVAIAGNLAFDPAFAALEQAARPGVITNTTKLTQVLQDPKNPVKQVLQARADEGFMAADRCAMATASLPPGERVAATVKWMKDNGYAARMKDDVAFAKGVEYHAFTASPHNQAAYAVKPDVELAKVEARLPLERPLMVSP